MAKSGKRIIMNIKLGLILNDGFGGGLLDGSDVATGFTAIAGEIAGECAGLMGGVLDSTSSEPNRTISYYLTTINVDKFKCRKEGNILIYSQLDSFQPRFMLSRSKTIL